MGECIREMNGLMSDYRPLRLVPMRPFSSNPARTVFDDYLRPRLRRDYGRELRRSKLHVFGSELFLLIRQCVFNDSASFF